MAYIARVSSPHQDNPEYAKLLKYCLEHGHWSVFEHAHATFEIVTSRMISAQILRHRSFTFSEFSQRYAEPMEYVEIKARRQAEKNRQSSIDDLASTTQDWWIMVQQNWWEEAERVYKAALDQGISKECARAILPMNTQTRLYMTGSIRSWLHYIELRTKEDTQLEHRDIAEAIKAELIHALPVVSKAIGWIK